jgi:hypothetical protein
MKKIKKLFLIISGEKLKKSNIDWIGMKTHTLLILYIFTVFLKL